MASTFGMKHVDLQIHSPSYVLILDTLCKPYRS